LLRGRPAPQAGRVPDELADRPDPKPAATNLVTDPVDESDVARSPNPVSEQSPISPDEDEGWVPA
jgi:hypothetical protein